MDIKWIESVAKKVVGDLKPDLTVWFDLPVAKGLKRARQRSALDRIESRDLLFHKKVRKGYAELHKKRPYIKRVVPSDIESTFDKVKGYIDELF